MDIHGVIQSQLKVTLKSPEEYPGALPVALIICPETASWAGLWLQL